MDEIVTEKRRPGRPRKNPVDVSAEVQAPRKRGRPPKKLEAKADIPLATPRKRGRPKKNVLAAQAAVQSPTVTPHVAEPPLVSEAEALVLSEKPELSVGDTVLFAPSKVLGRDNKYFSRRIEVKHLQDNVLVAQILDSVEIKASPVRPNRTSD